MSDDSEQKSSLLTYTSLEEEQQVNTIMRSLSIDEDQVDASSNSSDSQDLIVRVDKPEKHTEGYVSYCVTTKVALFVNFKHSYNKNNNMFQNLKYILKLLQE